MEEVKKILRIRNIEDFYGYEILFNIIIICFLSFLCIQNLKIRISAHVFTLLWISINSCQLVTLLSRHHCDFLFCESPKSNHSIFLLFLLTAILENVVFAALMFGYFIIAMHASPLYALLFTLLHFFYAIAIGIFAGTVYRQLKGLIPILLFYIWCIYRGGWWTTDEATRLWSPTIQLYHVNLINISNTVALIILIITFLLISNLIFHNGKLRNCWKIAGAMCLYIFFLLGVTMAEVSYNKAIENDEFHKIATTHRQVEYKGINEQNAIILADVIEGIKKELVEIKIIENEYSKFQFKRYYISNLYFLFHTRPIPVDKDNEIFYVNIYSDAMLNFEEYEIVKDMLNRIYDKLVSEESENNYIYQIYEGCREHILKDAILNNSNIYSKDLLDYYEKSIQKNSQTQTTQYNFLKKIASYLYYKYPNELANLYKVLEEADPQNVNDVKYIIENKFPQLLKEDNIQQLLY